MRQRVGFARALVVQPEVLFMDEPFSALDVLTAENLRSELLELWGTKKIDTKAIFIVTHNIEEAVLLADRVIVLGRNPARIRSDFNIALPQPRDRKSPPFLLYVDFIYKVMTRPDGDFALPAIRDPQPKAAYQLLPHARPGGIAGLLDVLTDAGGEEDLYHLAERLLMEVDDLLPIIEAAVLLGFAALDQGDVKLTQEGKVFTEAGIAGQKTIFRQAAISHVRLFQQIANILLPSPITASRLSCSGTFWMNIILTLKSNASLRPRCTGGAIAECLATIRNRTSWCSLSLQPWVRRRERSHTQGGTLIGLVVAFRAARWPLPAD